LTRSRLSPAAALRHLKQGDFSDGTRSIYGMLSVEFDSPTSGMKGLVYSSATDFKDNRVILYLHGSGGFGNGLAGLFQFPDLPSLLRDGMSLTSTVLIPSCHEGENWRPEVISDFLDDFEHSNDISKVKYDVVGYSRGGTGALYFAAFAPERVRTIVAIAARSASDVIHKITAIPTLLVHGTTDTHVSADESRRMQQSLCAAGGKCELMLLDGDHFIAADALTNESIFDWQRAAESNGDGSTQFVVPPPMLVVADLAVVAEDPQKTSVPPLELNCSPRRRSEDLLKGDPADE
jgi:pimeloyl-ACP methyl ester carboxylesterase